MDERLRCLGRYVCSRAGHEQDRSELVKRVIRFIDDPDTYDDFGDVISRDNKAAEKKRKDDADECRKARVTR